MQTPERLLLLMRRQRLTALALARELEFSPQTVRRWLRGEFQPIPAHARALERYFGCSIERLMAQVDD